MSIYPAGVQQTNSGLTGSERVTIDNGGAVFVTTTTQAIADLAGAQSAQAITALSTVGAGTITAAGIVGGITARSGSQSGTAFTDTTATGAQLDTALADAETGHAWTYTYENATNAIATLSGGSGVTVSGITSVGPGAQATYLITKTDVATYAMVGFLKTNPSVAQGTFTANGVTPVTVANKIVTANSSIIITLKTVGGTVGVSAPAIQTITAGTGFTVAALALDTSVYNYMIIG